MFDQICSLASWLTSRIRAVQSPNFSSTAETIGCWRPRVWNFHWASLLLKCLLERNCERTHPNKGTPTQNSTHSWCFEFTFATFCGHACWLQNHARLISKPFLLRYVRNSAKWDFWSIIGTQQHLSATADMCAQHGRTSAQLTARRGPSGASLLHRDVVEYFLDAAMSCRMRRSLGEVPRENWDSVSVAALRNLTDHTDSKSDSSICRLISSWRKMVAISKQLSCDYWIVVEACVERAQKRLKPPSFFCLLVQMRVWCGSSYSCRKPKNWASLRKCTRGSDCAKKGTCTKLKLDLHEKMKHANPFLQPKRISEQNRNKTKWLVSSYHSILAKTIRQLGVVLTMHVHTNENESLTSIPQINDTQINHQRVSQQEVLHWQGQRQKQLGPPGGQMSPAIDSDRYHLGILFTVAVIALNLLRTRLYSAKLTNFCSEPKKDRRNDGNFSWVLGSSNDNILLAFKNVRVVISHLSCCLRQKLGLGLWSLNLLFRFRSQAVVFVGSKGSGRWRADAAWTVDSHHKVEPVLVERGVKSPCSFESYKNISTYKCKVKWKVSDQKSWKRSVCENCRLATQEYVNKYAPTQRVHRSSKFFRDPKHLTKIHVLILVQIHFDLF